MKSDGLYHIGNMPPYRDGKDSEPTYCRDCEHRIADLHMAGDGARNECAIGTQTDPVLGETYFVSCYSKNQLADCPDFEHTDEYLELFPTPENKIKVPDDIKFMAGFWTGVSLTSLAILVLAWIAAG